MFKRLLPMNLQYFAEPVPDSGNEADAESTNNSQNDNGDGVNKDNNGENGSQGTGKQFDRKEVRGLISSAIDDFKKKSLPDLLEQARQDGENRANMTAEQRESADQKARQAELDKRESELNRRESINATRDLLAKENLPEDFAEVLNDVDTDKRAQHVEDFGKAFNKAVQAGVEERLKGKQTPGQTVNNGNDREDTKFAQELAAMAHPKKPASDFFGHKK
ncbi:DUF4355 domain-containing protein [Lactiplantibacillus plantarum]|uniref:DUF4355 domain-containing protein n=1 Tax=Lactiplantibacillus plantarum TaxID=1590 RepID=UPI00097575DA|nr:DUF4355 domain-containing protein [Lactiplantibacillus plantarum]